MDRPTPSFYTVEQSDSLAYISLQIYGSTNEYQTIFEAHHGKIQIGQRLVIPEA